LADASGLVVEFNPSAEELFGYSRAEALGRTVAELIVPPSLRDQHKRAYAHFVASGGKRGLGQRIELTAMHADGSEFPVELALSQIEGEPLLVCGAVRDLTRAKQAEADLRRLADEQRTLRRAATLVARAGDLTQVFEMVCSDIGRLLDAQHVELLQYGSEGTQDIMFAWSAPARGSAGQGADAGDKTLSLITVDGTAWGAIDVRADHPLPAPSGTVDGLAELTAVAISNAVARSELLASRTRIIAAADEARRRLQRDIHDSAQQRMVTSLIHLQLASERIDSDPGSAVRGVRAALDLTNQGLKELRDLAAGLHPTILRTGGLRDAVDGLAARSALPVTVRAPDGRYPSEAEVAIYFLVGEALTNIDKHARASHADVIIEDNGGSLVVDVRDDGVGGARLDAGSGLRGLQDRMHAFGGSLAIDSKPDEGTVIRATLPLRGKGKEGYRDLG
jgi:PAS domain S-box-containing protein